MKKVLAAIIAAAMLFGMMLAPAHAAEINYWFPPGWNNKTQQAQDIAKALSEKTGLAIKPQIAKSYPEIIKAFSTSEQKLVYVGSFIQAIVKARDLGTALVQKKATRFRMAFFP